jgi:F0F1-type ATP synthase membrane subunit b/b'
MDPAVIVCVSFVIFMGIAYRLGYRKSIATLDQKIATIRQTLEEATKAKEEALQALRGGGGGEKNSATMKKYWKKSTP